MKKKIEKEDLESRYIENKNYDNNVRFLFTYGFLNKIVGLNGKYSTCEIVKDVLLCLDSKKFDKVLFNVRKIMDAVENIENVFDEVRYSNND
jgi:hypothetical protein